MTTAIRRLKNDKWGDDVGLTAELLRHASRKFLDALLRFYNDVFYAGEPPVSWSKTLFTILKKKRKQNKLYTNFRPILNLRLLYKTFAYLLFEDWNMYWMHSNLENNMVSEQDDGLKSTFYQQIFCGTKQEQPVFWCGTSAKTCPGRLIGYTGQHCGQPCLSKEFLNISFGFYNGGATDNMVKLSVTSVGLTTSRSQAVCDKAALSVHGYFVLFWKLPRENGRTPLGRLAPT